MPSSLVTPVDLHLLKKEIEAQGEFLSQEKLERIADIDQISIELEAIRAALGKLIPGFWDAYEKSYAEQLHNFNPESKIG